MTGPEQQAAARGPHPARADAAGEVADMLIELHRRAGAQIPRALLLDLWKREYPEDRAHRAGADRPSRRGKYGPPGSEAAEQVRRGLVVLERAGAITRQDDLVVILDPTVLTRAAQG